MIITDTSLNGRFVKAITYIKNRRHLLMNYLDDAEASMNLYTLLENENMTDEEIEQLTPWSEKSSEGM